MTLLSGCGFDLPGDRRNLQIAQTLAAALDYWDGMYTFSKRRLRPAEPGTQSLIMSRLK